MTQDLFNSYESIGSFCRIFMVTKPTLPIRSSEMGLLIYLSKNGETTNYAIQASDFFKVSKPMITKMVKSLLREGLINQGSDPSDKRRLILTITPKGYGLLEATYEDYLGSVKRLMDSLGQENFNTLITLLDQANAILKEV